LKFKEIIQYDTFIAKKKKIKLALTTAPLQTSQTEGAHAPSGNPQTGDGAEKVVTFLDNISRWGPK
jgi:hypothetical protein